MGHDDMTSGVRKSLADVQGGLMHTASQEQAILRAAEARMAVIEESLAGNLSPAGRQEAVLERARLAKVISHSRAVLGPAS